MDDPGPPIPASQPLAPSAIETLLRLMADLRDPARGCPWDVAQSFSSIAPYTIEEAYEVADAIARDDLADLREELGDLLLQVVFHARMAEEQGAFGFADVAQAIAKKLIRRHPHVFDAAGVLLPAGRPAPDPDAVAAQWTRIKAEERRAKGGASEARASEGGVSSGEPDRLGGVALALPALTRAEKISRKAAAYGFDWADARAVVDKVREETEEVAQALSGTEQGALSGTEQGALSGTEPGALAEEIGDLLFAVANLARHVGIDPEAALRAGNTKFTRRFNAMAETLAAEGRPLETCDLATMEAAWGAVKRAERGEAG